MRCLPDFSVAENGEKFLAGRESFERSESVGLGATICGLRSSWSSQFISGSLSAQTKQYLLQ